MITIFKYPLELTKEENIFSLPKDYKIVHVDNQHGTVCVWAQIDTNKPKERVNLIIFGTGDNIDTNTYEHVGTCLQGIYVWHVYRRK